MPVQASSLPSVRICEATPTTRPPRSSTGPPELPWLIAASVWITPGRREVGGGRVDLAVQRRDDADRERLLLLLAERRADHGQRIADLEVARLAERCSTVSGCAGRVDLQHRDVVEQVVADQLRGQRVAVLEVHEEVAPGLHLGARVGTVVGRVGDDVRVREHVAVRRDDEAGAVHVLAADDGADRDDARRRRAGRSPARRTRRSRPARRADVTAGAAPVGAGPRTP